MGIYSLRITSIFMKCYLSNDSLHRRQKKYYARLKERKHDQSQGNSTFEDNSSSWKSEEGPLPVFPLRGGSFDSNPGSD